CIRRPAQVLADLRVVAIPTRDAARRIELVPPVERNPGDVLGYVDELVDRHQLRTAEVDRLQDVRVRDGLDALKQSSMYMKDRVWVPSPQISMSCLPVTTAAITLRQIAAGAFSRPPSHVPWGPYTLWNRAMRALSPKSSRKWRHMRSEKSFSHPYPSSGRAG